MKEGLNILQLMNFPDYINKMVVVILPIIITLTILRMFVNNMPRDRGKDYAIDGKQSKGKATGVGILLFFAFVLSYISLSTFEVKWLLLLIVLMFEMFTGYLDDKSSNPWSELVKGLLDLVACGSVALIYIIYSGHDLNLLLFSIKAGSIGGFVSITIFIWLCINSFNCCDGIDGLSGSMALNSLAFIALYSLYFGASHNYMIFIFVAMIILLVYLWFNTEKSSILMGDAGSRFIGMSLGILILETGHLWLAIPFALAIILDGFPGLLKILIIKVFKKNIIKMRFPLHDYLKKDLQWTNSQIITRLNILQLLSGVIALILIGVI